MSGVVRRTRAVSTRDASRRLSQLLDEIEQEDSAFLIVRYGRPAAMLVPFEETRDALRLPRVADLVLTPAVEEDESFDDVQLDPIQERVLLDMAHCTDRYWRIDRMVGGGNLTALMAAVTRLELAGLAEREWHGGILITRKGSSVARRLDSKT